MACASEPAHVDLPLRFASLRTRPLVFHPSNDLRNFAEIKGRAGLPRIGVHDIRHTHATFLLLDGVPLKVVSKRLGHAKTSITLHPYAHVLPGYQHLAVKSIGAALFG
jgi:integrase